MYSECRPPSVSTILVTSLVGLLAVFFVAYVVLSLTLEQL